MSAESAKTFFAKMKADDKFAKEVFQCKNFDEIAKTARAGGFSFTLDEFKAAGSVMDDLDLDKVVGGTNKLCCPSGWWFPNP